MMIVHSYAGASQADGAALNLIEPVLVSRFVGTVHAVTSPHYSRFAEEALLMMVTVGLVLATGAPCRVTIFYGPTM